MAYDQYGEERYAQELDIYGGVRSFGGDPAVSPFRYPGQVYDGETGLCYNRFRYYDPEEGFYISQDPIGLAGENPTLYGYVGDVNNWTDVLGLSAKPETATQWEHRFNNLDPSEQYGAAKGKLQKVANRNGWTQNNTLSRRNGRDVYLDNNGRFYGADTQHGRFEYHDKKGNHLGEFNIDGIREGAPIKNRKLCVK